MWTIKCFSTPYRAHLFVENSIDALASLRAVAANARALTHWAMRLSAVAFHALKELRLREICMRSFLQHVGIFCFSFFNSMSAQTCKRALYLIVLL